MGCGTSNALFVIRSKKGIEDFSNSLPNDLLQRYDKFSLLYETVEQLNNEDFNYNNNNSNNNNNSGPEDSCTVHEDPMVNLISRTTRLLVNDLECLLSTEVYPILDETKTDWTKDLPHPDKFFDLVIVLTTVDPANRRYKYRTYAHKAIMASRSQFFNSKLGLSSQHRTVNSSGIGLSGGIVGNGGISVGGVSRDSESSPFNVAHSLPERVSRLRNLTEVVQLEFELPHVVKDASSFLIVLEYLYTGLFRPEFSSKMKSLVEENNLTTLIEILAISQYFSILQLKNCAMFHMCDLIEKNVTEEQNFQSFINNFCPTIPFVKLKKDVKLVLEIEHVFNDYKKVKRKLFYSPMQSKKQLEKDFEKMYIHSNTSSMMNLSSADFSDVRLSISLPRNASSGGTMPISNNGSVQFGPRHSTRKVFRIHKSVLTTRSNYFKAYFMNTETPPSDLIDMPKHLNFALLKAFVHFIYTDTLREEHEPLLPDLLPLAEQYSVPGLRIMCLKSYYDKLTAENILEEYAKHCSTESHYKRLCLCKMAVLYPILYERVLHLSDHTTVPTNLDDRVLTELTEQLHGLHLRLNFKLIWDRVLMRNFSVEQMYPNARSKHKSKGKTLKILVIGDANVGKKTLVEEIRKTYVPTESIIQNPKWPLYVLVDHSNKTDSESLENFSSKYDGFILTYSLADYTSYQNVVHIFERIRHCLESKSVILVGNKVDLQLQLSLDQSNSENITVEPMKSIQLAKQLRIPYIETQADIGANVTDIVTTLAKEIFVSDIISLK
jgi:GTPase SAR1 family protein